MRGPYFPALAVPKGNTGVLLSVYHQLKASTSLKLPAPKSTRSPQHCVPLLSAASVDALATKSNICRTRTGVELHPSGLDNKNRAVGVK